MRNQTTPPAAEPVTLAEAKTHLGGVIPGDDAMVTALIVAAREQAELFTRRAFVVQSWDMCLDAFPLSGRIDLPLPPLQQVNSVKYLDAKGVEQTLAVDKYRVVKSRDEAYIELVYGTTWPSTRDVSSVVTVNFTAGYPPSGADPNVDPAANIPASIKAAILLLVGEMYENREETGYASMIKLPLTAERLLWPFRDLRF